MHQYALDATIAGGAITGTWKSADGKRSGKVSGWIKTEKELQAANAFTKGKDWALYHGSLSSFAAAPCGLTLATDPKDFRLVWKKGHKIGPVNNTPCVGDGKVFAMGSLGRVYALDAQTGKPLWEVPNITPNKLPEGFDRPHANAPVYIDGVVVGNQGHKLYGFDAKTGAELWKLEGKISHYAVPSLWTHQGKSYIISHDFLYHQPDKIYCIEPKSGKVAWETDFKGGFKGVSVSGDILVGLIGSLRGEPPKDPQCVAWRMTPKKAERIWATTVKAHGELSSPAVNDQYVVVGNGGGQTQPNI